MTTKYIAQDRVRGYKKAMLRRGFEVDDTRMIA
jgi:hypothetical protein